MVSIIKGFFSSIHAANWHKSKGFKLYPHESKIEKIRFYLINSYNCAKKLKFLAWHEPCYVIICRVDYALFDERNMMRTFKLHVVLTLLLAFSQAYGRGVPISEKQYFSEMRLETSLEGMSYPTDYEGSKEAYRMGIGFNRNQSLLGGFQWSLDAKLWASTPQEVAHWFNVAQANLTYRTYNWFLSFGRFLPAWGGVSYYSPIQQIFPTFNIDPLNYQVNGLTGLYTNYESKPWSYEFFWSPLFIPHSGGARYKEESDGSLIPSSRWAQPLYYSFKQGEAFIPLKYKLQKIDFIDILFQNSLAVRASYKSESLDIAFAAADVMDPEARLHLDPTLQIKDEKDLKTLVKIYPEFYTERVYSIEVKARPLVSENINFLLETAYIDPTNPDDSEKNIFKTKKVNSLFGVSYLGQNTLIKSFSSGLLYSKEYEKYKQPKFIKLEEANLRFFSNIEVRLFSTLSLLFFGESDFKLNDTALKTSLLYNVTRNIYLGGGIDILKGAPDTYWGQFGSHDRIWLKIQYVF